MLLYSTPLPVGWQAPEFELPDTKGNLYQLAKQQLKYGIVVIFICNNCPYAKAALPLLVKLHKKYHKKGFEFVAINPNDEKTDLKESFGEIPFPYLRDETQKVAKKYQAQCTPDTYLFNKDRKLFYHGRINDNWQDSKKVKRADLDDALNRLYVGDKAPIEQFPSMGCSIKWK